MEPAGITVGEKYLSDGWINGESVPLSYNDKEIYKMKKTLLISSVVTTLLVASTASAQPFTLRVEPGLAISNTAPQSNRFGPIGGALAVKPEIGLNSYLSFGPSFQFVGLPSKVSGVETGTAWSYGLFGRVKRPHDERNTGKGLEAISPWVEADVRYVYTGGLNRFGWSTSIGAQLPTSDSRQLWMGPFASYQTIHQEDGKPGFNTNSAKTLIFGVSFEFGAITKKAEEKKIAQESKPQETPKQEEPKEEPKPSSSNPPADTETFTMEATVGFDFDSAELKLTDKEKHTLTGIFFMYLAWHKDFTITITGHASSEGQAEYNDKLSLRRAESVKKWLLSHRMPSEKIIVKGNGASQPIADNSTEEGRKKNRRVEFDIQVVVKTENKQGE